MRTLGTFFLVICLTAEARVSADEESARQQIRQWIQQLGDDSFLVRQRAESLLIHAGIQAYPELQRAKQSHDVEIVRRAEYVLSQIEQIFRDMENQETAALIQLYVSDPNPAFKAQIIWNLADPFPTPGAERGYEKGEGLPTLCRLVQFEENPSLRLEAAKTLIASPPLLPVPRQTWYRHIRDTFHVPGNDEILQSLTRYAKLWCDLDEADIKATPAFLEQVNRIGAETLRLLDRPENGIQIGSKIDILLHYAVAELQDAAGLTEDRDKTISKALAVQPQPLQTPEPILRMGLVDDLGMNEHFHVGWYLQWRFRLRWAMAHFQKVAETGAVLLRVQSNRSAAETAIDIGDYSLAIAFLDKQIEILESSDYTDEYGDSAKSIAQTQRRKIYCLAEKAAAEGDWEKVRENTMRALPIPDGSMEMADLDLVILAYRLCKRQPDIDSESRNKMESALKQMWKSVMDHYEGTPILLRLEEMPSTCNSAAWLLANTDGNYRAALTLIDAALQAEPGNVMYLDTLAHVYFLGGKTDEAILTQEQVVRMAPESAVFRKALERFRQQR